MFICHFWLHPHTERELWSQGHSSAENWPQRVVGQSTSWGRTQTLELARQSVEAAFSPGSGMPKAPKALPLHPPPRCPRANTAAPIRLAWQHRGARCPGASFPAPQTFSRCLPRPCPRATRQFFPGPAVGQRVNLPPFRLWGDSDPTEIMMPPTSVMCGHISTQIWGKEASVF